MSGPMWMPTAPPTLPRLLAVHLQPLPVLPALALLLLVAYALGIVVLARRGDRWPVSRTVGWAAGTFSMLAMTATGLDGYGMKLFSVHMIQHMVLAMVTPLLLVTGAPITLLLRSLSGGQRRQSVRRFVLAVVHSRVAQTITHPLATVTLFLFSLYGLYFTPVFDELMSTMWGHNLMLLHFVAVGGLYFWGVLGIDPAPRRRREIVSAPLRRVLELTATLPFHAFFGVAVMMSSTLIVGYYAHPISGWGIQPLADQQAGGGIAWGFTELPTLAVLGILFFRSERSERKANARAGARGTVRATTRADDEFGAYNAYLSRLETRDRSAL